MIVSCVVADLVEREKWILEAKARHTQKASLAPICVYVCVCVCVWKDTSLGPAVLTRPSFRQAESGPRPSRLVSGSL